ncbi:MAG: SDR family NAD(P)-dependent oxidoreductase [Deltaproteobacteria bacterium]|nr:SDR family NAD(P)-dependent oxidoreductase [Deltaproteobacteria bacterium]
MPKTILVAGHGPGISHAVAHEFGRHGFQVALVARNAERLDAATRELTSAGIVAKPFPCDLADADAITKLVTDVRTTLGPLTVIHWNAYAGLAGDLTTASLADLRTVFEVGVFGSIAALQAALPDLREQAGTAALLITGGGFSFYSEQVDRMIVQWNTMGLALSKAAQHKLVGVLHHKLAGEGIYVGEVVVLGMVKGTAFDGGHATLDAADIAREFWRIYEGRDEISVNFGG